MASKKYEVLANEILLLSHSQVWEIAVFEWVIIAYDHEGEVDTCLCGHHPIKLNCRIQNTVTGNTAIVGSCCINHFGERGQQMLSVTRNLTRIREDLSKSVNKTTALMAYERGVLTPNEVKFCADTEGHRKLDTKQQLWRERINQKLLDAMVIKKKQPKQTIASIPRARKNYPSLAQFSFDAVRDTLKVIEGESTCKRCGQMLPVDVESMKWPVDEKSLWCSENVQGHHFIVCVKTSLDRTCVGLLVK